MSREKYNIQFRIRAVDNFSKTMDKFHARLENIKRHAESVDDVILDVNVVGDAKAKRDLKKVERAADALERKNLFIMIKTNQMEAWKGFRGLMGKIAHLSRDASELFTSMFGSAIFASAPALAGALKGVVAVVGSLGPMIGALAGGTFALATALGVAGIAAAGFGAVAFPSIKKVFDANSKLKELQEELNETSDDEERADIMKQMAAITDGLTRGQKKSLNAVNSLGSSFNDLSNSIEPQAMYVFANSVQVLEDVMNRLTPMVEEAAKVAVNLTDSLRINVQADDFKAFINFLNTSAGPIMSDIFKGLGNFTMGLINMMTAFGPLAGDTAKGFNNMGDSFRDWAAGLSESDRFQAFVDYVKTEGPKVLSVLGGTIVGLMDMFAAFGPFTSGLLDGLLEMIDGFKEWARTLEDNQGFQDFIDYVTNHGPDILEFFGEFREFLMHVINGFAEASLVMTPFITDLLNTANAFLEANPWVMKFVGYLSTLVGVALLVFVPLRLLWTIIKMLIAPITALVQWLGPKLLPAMQWLGSMIYTYVLPALGRLWEIFLRAAPILGRVAGVFLRFISGPVGWVIAGIELLRYIFDVSWSDIWNWTKDTFRKIGDWISTKIDEVVATGVIISAWVGGIIDYFGDLWDGVKEKMGNIKDGITGAWDDTMAFLDGIDLWDTGASILQGLVDGILSIDLAGIVSGLASKLPDWIKGPLKIKSPSKVTEKLGGFVGEGMAGGIIGSFGMVKNAAQRLAGAAIPSATRSPYQGINPTTSPRYGGGYRTQGEQRNLDEDSRKYSVEVPVYLNGREIAKATVDDISKEQERREIAKQRSRGYSV